MPLAQKTTRGRSRQVKRSTECIPLFWASRRLPALRQVASGRCGTSSQEKASRSRPSRGKQRRQASGGTRQEVQRTRDPASGVMSSYVFLMHVKCIHELCIILLIFQSYLHHIRVISLFYNDFGNISQFPYFSRINSAQAENPIFYVLIFQGPKRRPNDLKIYGEHFLEEQSEGKNDGEKWRPEGRKGVAHAARKVEARRPK